MKPVTIFYLESCPYCMKAKKAIAELQKESPAFAALPLTWVEESRDPKTASGYDYYYVPTLFSGREKLYEASPAQGYDEIKASIRAAFQAACED